MEVDKANEKEEVKAPVDGRNFIIETLVGILLYASYLQSQNNIKGYLTAVFIFVLSIRIFLLIFSFRETKIFWSIFKLVLQSTFIYYFLTYTNPFYNLLFFWVPCPFLFKVMNYFLLSCYFSRDLLISKKHSKINFLKSLIFYRLYEILTHSFRRFLKFLFMLLTIKLAIFIIYDKFSDYMINKNSLNQQKFFIAANLFNNEDILHDWQNELKNLINFLGPSNCYVSIAENGDSSDNTGKLLDEFKKELDNLKVKNKIITHKVVEKKNFERIEFLAMVRNLAMAYIYEIPELDFSNTKIIFLNDVIYSYRDILNLLMTNDQNYDLACGLDFYESFYDVWVSRGIDGFPLSFYYPYFPNKVAAERVINGENVRVFTCWNGAIVMKAEPFKDKELLYFRPNKKYRQSECTVLIVDMLYLGYNKVILNPNVKFTYTYYYHYMNKYVYPWTKNVFTYFYYFFQHFNLKPEFNYANLSDDNVINEDFLRVIENILKKD